MRKDVWGVGQYKMNCHSVSSKQHMSSPQACRESARVHSHHSAISSSVPLLVTLYACGCYVPVCLLVLVLFLFSFTINTLLNISLDLEVTEKTQ